MPRTRREEIDELLETTRCGEESARAEALRRLCPCQVKRDEPRVWTRVLELTRDPSRRVRAHAVHLLADGSPRRLEGAALAALDALRNDEDLRLRRRVRQLLARHRRGGTINVL